MKKVQKSIVVEILPKDFYLAHQFPYQIDLRNNLVFLKFSTNSTRGLQLIKSI